MLFIASQKIFIFTTIKNNIMAGIDDDLMDGGTVFPSKDEQQVIPRKEQPVNPITPQERGQGMDLVLKIVHYIIDAAMIVLSIFMMEREDAYPLVFCVGLIVWMAYRILYFKRNNTVDIIIGLFLFAAATFFYVYAIVEDYSEITGRILIPTVYLSFFCVWGAIRRKRNGEERNNK